MTCYVWDGGPSKLISGEEADAGLREARHELLGVHNPDTP